MTDIQVGSAITLGLPNGQSLNATVTSVDTPKPRRTISTGQRYEGPSGMKYILAATGPYIRGNVCVTMIALQDGNRWSEPKPVASTRNITDDEFRDICSTGSFRLIEGGAS